MHHFKMISVPMGESISGDEMLPLAKTKNRTNIIRTGALFILFVVFTMMVATVDVAPIGPEHSSVGFATLNQFVFTQLGENFLWYEITHWVGIFVIIFALCFAASGLYQLIQTGSLWKVDYHLLLLSILYILIAVLYFLFEVVIINYRPIILHTGLEASYPSSHTMIITAVMGSAMLFFHHKSTWKKSWLIIMDSISVMIMGITVIGRLISGVHWFTDIVGGLILAAALIMLYYSAISAIKEKYPQ